MAALNAIIKIGKLAFDKAVINSVNTVEDVSILGNELRYDTMEATIYYDWHKTGFDIRGLVYGTEIIYYIGEELQGKYYLDTISRTSAVEYHLNCISAIGLLDRRAHTGGLYFGVPFKTILASIINNEFPYTIKSKIADTKVYGWLPLDSARNNLRQLLFALNVHVIRDSNKNVVFTLFDNESPEYIESGRVYNEGSEEILQIATKVTVTEHSFYYLPGTSEEELFNNSEGYVVDNYLVSFSNAPVYLDSLKASDGLVLHSANVNYAIVSGRGVLTGIPYTHRTFDVIRTGNEEAKPYESSVSDVTLISIANSENIADRLFEYYSSRIKVSADIKYTSETCGKLYTFTDAFYESTTGFLSHIQKSISSFIKAHGEFILNYSGGAFGNNFNNCVVLTSTTGGTWTVPEGTTRLRVVLIGGGEGGTSGTAGSPGVCNSGGKGGKGGKAGQGGRIYQFEIAKPAESYHYRCGTGGNGGVTCQDTENPNVGALGTDTHFGLYSSYNGASSSGGYCESLTSGTIYALPGRNGLDGGSGGNGGTCDSDHFPDKEAGQSPEVININTIDGYASHNISWWTTDENGDYVYACIAGTPSVGVAVDIKPNININGVPAPLDTAAMHIVACGGGGGGPTRDVRLTADDLPYDYGVPSPVDASGTDVYSGFLGTITYVGATNENNSTTLHYTAIGGFGGMGLPGLDQYPATVYGSGGNGGCGGGGGGGFGSCTTGSQQYTATDSSGNAYTCTISVTEKPFEAETSQGADHESLKTTIGGDGGAGGNGAQGCVIIYY